MLEEIFKISDYPYLLPDSGFGHKLLRLFKTYGWLLLAMIAVGPIIVLTDKFVVDVLHHKSLSMVNRHLFQQLHKKLGVWYSLLFICVLGPVFEELIFRFPLSFKKRNIVVGGVVAVFYITASLFTGKDAGLKIMVELPFIVIAGLLCWFLIPATPLNLSAHFKRRLIITSMCLFGLMHVFNFRPVDYTLLALYPVYIVPQLLMGWAISYTRFKNGFIWGVALHCLINTVATLLSFHKW